MSTPHVCGFSVGPGDSNSSPLSPEPPPQAPLKDNFGFSVCLFVLGGLVFCLFVWFNFFFFEVGFVCVALGDLNLAL